jgi:hypothetical protein
MPEPGDTRRDTGRDTGRDTRKDASKHDPRTGYEIWVSCDDCGDVVIAGERCVLFRTTASATATVVTASGVTLAYPCVQCGRRSVTPVPDAALRRLVERGFSVIAWSPPLELLEPHPTGPPFTWDDLLEAHEVLARSDAIVALLS